jgi:TolB-like protein/Tfp pilus assembly protein PilF
MNRFAGGPRSLLRELNRRHVFRVAFAYAVTAWVVIQVASHVFPALLLPEWSVRLVTMLAILGFPIAVVLAWAFDLTPEGIQRTDRLDSSESSSASDGEVAHDRGPAARETAGAAGDSAGDSLRSLVVLPFVDRSPNSEHQYLGDGITEELISGLARIAGLRVISRTTAFALRGDHIDAREIGARLGIGSLVEGSLRVAGDRLRLTVQLVGVGDGYAIWSETFDRRIEDVFCVQEEVAEAVLAALRGRLAQADEPTGLGKRNGPLLRRSTSDLQAYDLYLHGRFHWSERTPDALQTAIRFFERAVAADPGFAHAHAGLADCFTIQLDYGLLAPATGIPRARAAAHRALTLDPGLAEAHTSLGLVQQMEGNWGAAEASFRRAMELNPGYVVARHRYGLFLAWMGRFEESRAELSEAHRLDPLSPLVESAFGWVAYFAGDYAEAKRVERHVLQEHPRFAPARVPLALACLRTGESDQAVAELRRVIDETGDTTPNLALLVLALARQGSDEEAARLAHLLRQRAETEYVPAYYLAVAALALGDEERAIRELERAVEQRAPQVVYLRAEPLFATLQPSDRFARLLERVGFPASPAPSGRPS